MGLIGAILAGARAPAIILPPAVLVGSSSDIWLPDYWFRSGEPGDYWHLANLDGIYQESTGVTPAAVGQAVGLMLGRRYGGARGADFITNGDFSSATGWTAQTGWTIGSGVATVNSAAAGSTYLRNGTSVVGMTYEVTFTVTAYTSGNVFAAAGSATAPGAAQAVGTYTRMVTATTTDGVGVYASSTNTVATVDNVSARPVPGIHRIQSTAINRPTLQQDATGRYYLSYNGSNSWMQTAATVDLTSTDKVTLVTGIRKESDAAVGMVHELSVGVGGNNGSFWLAAPVNNGVANFNWASKGTAQASANAEPYVAPTTKVITGIGDISGDVSQMRINGAVVSTTTTDQGTGNYGNYTMYSGARAGTSLYFNGREYFTILRGALGTETEYERAERWGNRLVGAF